MKVIGPKGKIVTGKRSILLREDLDGLNSSPNLISYQVKGDETGEACDTKRREDTHTMFG